MDVALIHVLPLVLGCLGRQLARNRSNRYVWVGMGLPKLRSLSCLHSSLIVVNSDGYKITQTFCNAGMRHVRLAYTRVQKSQSSSWCLTCVELKITPRDTRKMARKFHVHRFTGSAS